MRTNHSLEITWLLGAVLCLALGVGACFGRSEPDGLGLSDRAAGEPCRQDTDCIVSLACIQGVCGGVGVDPVPPRDVGTSDVRGGDDGRPTDTGGIDNRPADAGRDVVDPTACPGFVGFITPGDTVEGSTSGQTNRYEASCGGEGAPDAVWVLDLTADQAVSLTTEGSQFDTILYLFSSCGSGEMACNDDNPDGTGVTSQVSLDRLTTGLYYVVVDGWGSSAGDYVLSAK